MRHSTVNVGRNTNVKNSKTTDTVDCLSITHFLNYKYGIIMNNYAYLPIYFQHLRYTFYLSLSISLTISFKARICSNFNFVRLFLSFSFFEAFLSSVALMLSSPWKCQSSFSCRRKRAFFLLSSSDLVS